MRKYVAPNFCTAYFYDCATENRVGDTLGRGYAECCGTWGNITYVCVGSIYICSRTLTVSCTFLPLAPLPHVHHTLDRHDTMSHHIHTRSTTQGQHTHMSRGRAEGSMIVHGIPHSAHILHTYVHCTRTHIQHEYHHAQHT